MGDYADLLFAECVDPYWGEEEDDEDDWGFSPGSPLSGDLDTAKHKTCRRCGRGQLYFAKDGKGHWRLFEKPGTEHKCPPLEGGELFNPWQEEA